MQVGLPACQIAKSLGLCVIGTAGHQDGLDLLNAEKVDYVFNHNDPEYIKKIKVNKNLSRGYILRNKTKIL